MAWPSNTLFADAIQTPDFCFEHPDLKGGKVRVDQRGMPATWAGNFACVFQVSRSTSRKFAVRCFTREVGDQRDRYGQLAGFLKDNKPESFVGFEYLDRGIRVKGAWYPIVKMDWVEGDTLDKFVETRLNENKPNEIQDMAAKWLQTTMDLRRRHIVHSNLQHGNTMVQGGNFRLVDYDGVILPKLPKKSSSEVGHANYQHPQRSDQHYGDYVDNFPALVLYLSLLAISADPGLWASFNTGQNLILTKQDYRNPKDSKCFKALKQSPDTAVASLAAYLEECCHKPVDQVPNLESILQRLNTPLGRPSPSPSEFRELLRTSQATAPPVPNQRKSPAPQVPVSRQTRLPVKPPTHPTAQPTYVGPTGTDAVGYFNDGQSRPVLRSPRQGDNGHHLRMLELINIARRNAGVPKVALGNNPAPQMHANSCLQTGTVSHWNLNGLKPYMRYSLVGGCQNNAENWFDQLYGGSPGVTDIAKEINYAMTSLMNSPGHRDTILDRWYRKVSIGLAWDRQHFVAIQHFEGDFVEYGRFPTITDGMLRFSVRVKSGVRFRDDDNLSVDIWYDPPPCRLTQSQLLRVNAYDGGVIVASIRRPLSAGYCWQQDSGSIEIQRMRCPEDIPHDEPMPASFEERRALITEAYRNNQFVHCSAVSFPFITAQEWIQGDEYFSIEADISSVINRCGPGVYSLVLWAPMDQTEETANISRYSIFVNDA